MKAAALTAPGAREFSDKVFENLDLKGAELADKKFLGCTFRRCDLTGAYFRLCLFRDCRFESCNLSLARPGGSVFDGAEFRDSKLVGMNWTDAGWPKLRLSGPPKFFNCVLSDCNFLGLDLAGTAMKSCLAKEADLREAALAKADLSGTDFSGALFGGNDLRKADLTGARNYAISPDGSKLKGAKFSLPEAMALLQGLGIELV